EDLRAAAVADPHLADRPRSDARRHPSNCGLDVVAHSSIVPNSMAPVGLYDLLRRQRMVRHYSAEPVPREVLERIAATVRRAPSAGFSQGQRLLVVDDRALIEALARDEQAEGTE